MDTFEGLPLTKSNFSSYLAEDPLNPPDTLNMEQNRVEPQLWRSPLVLPLQSEVTPPVSETIENHNENKIFLLESNTVFATDPLTGNILPVGISSENNLIHLSANNPPLLANPIPEQTAYQNRSFSFTVPDYTFADAGDTLTYSATLGDGSPLPNWLSFNTATRTFSGTPTNAGNLNLKITATDSVGNSVSDTFVVSVFTSSYSINGYAHGIETVNNYAYVASAWGGLQILDISNPNAPTLLGSYDTAGYSRDVTVSGNYAYIADSNSGLQILDITNRNSPTLVGSGGDSVVVMAA
jgi:hypothetical protein